MLTISIPPFRPPNRYGHLLLIIIASYPILKYFQSKYSFKQLKY